MTQVRLTRISTDKTHGTFGAVTVNGVPFCVSLEPYTRDNKQTVSCIPTGMYTCERYSSPKYPNTFEVTDVAGRTSILFHSGNTDEDTEGCILFGSSYGKLSGNRAILNSGNTFKQFIKNLEDEDTFTLVINEAF